MGIIGVQFQFLAMFTSLKTFKAFEFFKVKSDDLKFFSDQGLCRLPEFKEMF